MDSRFLSPDPFQPYLGDRRLRSEASSLPQPYYYQQQQQQQPQPQQQLLLGSTFGARASIAPVAVGAASSLVAPSAIPSLSSGQGFYTIESLQGATTVPPVPPPRVVPTERDRSLGGPSLSHGFERVPASRQVYDRLPAVQQGYERGPAAQRTFERVPDERSYAHLQRVPSVGTAPRRVNQGVRSPERRGMYLSHARLTGFHSEREPAAALTRPGLVHGWTREREREVPRGWVQPWDRDRARFERADFDRDLTPPYQRARLESQFKRDRPFRGLSPPPVGPIAKRQGKRAWCAVCRIDCSSPAMLKEHLAGKRHKRQLEIKKSESEAKTEAAKKEVSDKVEEVKEITKEGGGQTSLAAAVAKAIDHGKKRKRDRQDLRTAKKRQQDGSGDGTDSAVKEKKSDTSQPSDQDIEKPVIAEVPEQNAERQDAPVSKKFNKSNKNTQKNNKVDMKQAFFEKCEVCDVLCSGRSTLQAHFAGKKHLARIKELLDAETETKKGVTGNSKLASLASPITNGDEQLPDADNKDTKPENKATGSELTTTDLAVNDEAPDISKEPAGQAVSAEQVNGSVE